MCVAETVFCTCWFHLGTLPLLQISAPLGFYSGRVHTASTLNSLLGVRPLDPQCYEDEEEVGDLLNVSSPVLIHYAVDFRAKCIMCFFRRISEFVFAFLLKVSLKALSQILALPS